MKKIFSILVFTIAGINFLFAQCLPESNLNEDGALAGINTGSNMTVMLTSFFIDELPLNDDQFGVIVAVSDGIIIGSSIVELIEKNQHNKALMHKKIIKFITSIRSSLGT